MPVPDNTVRTLAAFGGTHPDIRALYIFGSRLEGEARADSDLDVGVLFTHPQTLETTLRLEEELARSLPDRIDLVDVARAGAFVALAIIRGERVFVRDEDEADRFELYVLRRAGDLLPFERARQAMLLSPRG